MNVDFRQDQCVLRAMLRAGSVTKLPMKATSPQAFTRKKARSRAQHPGLPAA